jgi:CheY-like chemotaxis protein
MIIPGKEKLTMNKPVLIVDDNPLDVDLTKLALQHAGLENPIQIARDGEAALGYVGRWEAGDANPAIILLDVNMPKMNGIDVYKNLQVHPEFRSIPIIFLLSCEDDQIILKKNLNSAPPYIIKPVSIENFIRATALFGLKWSFS